jgi:shikimate kinase
MSKARQSRFRNILVAGLPGVGKSTFARAYAQLSRTEFVELDQYVERLAGRSVTDIFDKDGEAAFRRLELQCLERLLKRQRCTIALGGGTLTHLESLKMAQQLGCVVLLQAPVRDIAARLWTEKETRPLLKDCDSVEALEKRLDELWSERKDSYAKADITLDATHSSVDNLKIELAWLERRLLELGDMPRDELDTQMLRDIPMADPNYRSPREHKGGTEIVDKMERYLKSQNQKERAERKDRRDKKGQRGARPDGQTKSEARGATSRHMRGEARRSQESGSNAQTAGPTPRANGPTPRANGPTPRADGPTPRADGPTPRADGPTPRADGPTPRAESLPRKDTDLK